MLYVKSSDVYLYKTNQNRVSMVTTLNPFIYAIIIFFEAKHIDRGAKDYGLHQHVF